MKKSLLRLAFIRTHGFSQCAWVFCAASTFRKLLFGHSSEAKGQPKISKISSTQPHPNLSYNPEEASDKRRNPCTSALYTIDPLTSSAQGGTKSYLQTEHLSQGQLGIPTAEAYGLRPDASDSRAASLGSKTRLCLLDGKTPEINTGRMWEAPTHKG